MTEYDHLKEFEEEIDQIHGEMATLLDRIESRKGTHETFADKVAHYADMCVSTPKRGDPPEPRFKIRNEDNPYWAPGSENIRFATWYSEYDDVGVSLWLGNPEANYPFNIDVEADQGMLHEHEAGTLIGALRAVEMCLYMTAHLAEYNLRNHQTR